MITKVQYITSYWIKFLKYKQDKRAKWWHYSGYVIYILLNIKGIYKKFSNYEKRGKRFVWWKSLY